MDSRRWLACMCIAVALCSGSRLPAALEAAPFHIAVFAETYEHTAFCGGSKPAGLSLQEAGRWATNNFGNQVWAHAAASLFDQHQVSFSCLTNEQRLSGSNGVRALRREPGSTMPLFSALLVPVANLLFDVRDLNSTDYARVKQAKANMRESASFIHLLHDDHVDPALPVYLVGVGIQAFFGDDIANFRISSVMIRMLQAFQSHGHSFSVRGPISHVACQKAQLNSIDVSCPSLMLNHAPDLGRKMEDRTRAFVAKRDYSARVLVSMPWVATLPELMQVKVIEACARMLETFPNSKALLQTDTDFETLTWVQNVLGRNLTADRIIYYYDVLPWQDAMRNGFDFVFATRIHGGMVAVSAAVPTLVLPTDYRIQELVQSMHLMTATLEQFDMFNGMPFDLFDLLASISKWFNGTSFDENRALKAKAYAEWFQRANMPVHPGILGLISTCVCCNKT